MHFTKSAVVEATCIALCADSHWRGSAAVARRNITKDGLSAWATSGVVLEMMRNLGTDVVDDDGNFDKYLRNGICNQLRETIFASKARVTMEDWRSVCSIFFDVNLEEKDIAMLDEFLRAEVQTAEVQVRERAQTAEPTKQFRERVQRLLNEFKDAEPNEIIAKMVQKMDLQRERSRRLRHSGQQRRRGHAKEAALQETIDELKKQLEDATAKLCWRRGRCMSRRGAYTMALTRALNPAGGKSTIAMMAGSQERGGFNQSDVVFKFTHYACIAQRLKAKDEIECMQQFALLDSDDVASYKALPWATGGGGGDGDDPIWEIELTDGEPNMPNLSCRIIHYAGDATNHEAFQKLPVHVARMELLADGNGGYVVQVKGIPDIQAIQYHTGEELYRIMIKEYDSVKFPNWLHSKANEVAVLMDGHAWWEICSLIMHVLDLDHGPDNTWIMRVLVAELKNSIHTIMTGEWCFLHSLHHSVEAMAKVLNKWRWPEDVDDDPTNKTQYVSGIKIVANTFRTPSIASRVFDVVVLVHGLDVATTYFTKIISRVILTRWLSLQSVEATLHDQWSYLRSPQVLDRLIKGTQKRDRLEAMPDGGAAADPDEGLRTLFSKWRGLARRILVSMTRQISTTISHNVKMPTTGAQAWMMKRLEEMNKATKEAEDQGDFYSGKTLLSDLVSWKAGEVKQQIANNLLDDVWKSLWDFIDEYVQDLAAEHMVELKVACRELIIHLNFVQAANWDFRVMDRIMSLPLLFLKFLNAPPHVDDRMRRHIGWLVLSSPDEKLVNPKTTDMPLKFKYIFFTDFQWMYQTGRLTQRLQGALLKWRSKQKGVTQFIEGMISTLQLKGKRAPNMQRPLAAAEMSLRYGPSLSAEECVDMHPRVLQFVRSPESHARFSMVVPTPIERPRAPHLPDVLDAVLAPVREAADPLAPQGHALAVFVPEWAKRAAAPLCSQISKWAMGEKVLGAHYVYQIARYHTLAMNFAFFLGASFSYIVYCGRGELTVSTDNPDVGIFQWDPEGSLSQPSSTCLQVCEDFIAREVSEENVGKQMYTVKRYEVLKGTTWIQFGKAEVDLRPTMITRKTIAPKRKMRRPPPAAPQRDDADLVPMEDAAEGGDGGDDDHVRAIAYVEEARELGADESVDGYLERELEAFLDEELPELDARRGDDGGDVVDRPQDADDRAMLADDDEEIDGDETRKDATAANALDIRGHPT